MGIPRVIYSAVRQARPGWITITLTLIAVVTVSTAVPYGVLGSLAAPLETERSPMSNGQARGEMAASQSGDNTTSGSDMPGRLSSGRYGGFEITVVGARPIPENTSGRPIIVVEIEVGNLLDFRLRLPRSMVSLIDESDRVVPVQRFEPTERLTRLTVRPGERQRATLVVRLDPGMSTDLDRYHLQIAEPGRWPLRLPLAGTVGDDGAEPTSPRPSDDDRIGLDVLHRPTATAPGTSSPADGIESVEAVVALNHQGYRAKQNHYLITVTLEVSSTAIGNLDRMAQNRWWSLASGKARYRAISARIVHRAASAARLQVIFEPPISASTLSFRADDEGWIAGDLADLTVPTKWFSQEAEPETA